MYKRQKEGEAVHLFGLDTDECRYLWVPLSSLCQLSTNIGHLALVLLGYVNSQVHLVINFWDLSWQRSKSWLVGARTVLWGL